MASAEVGSVSSGVAYGKGCPLSSRLRGLGSVVSSPSGVRGRAPAVNAILAYFEGHRTLIFTALHVMQPRYSEENTVRPSVRLSHARIVTKR